MDNLIGLQDQVVCFGEDHWYTIIYSSVLCYLSYDYPILCGMCGWLSYGGLLSFY